MKKVSLSLLFIFILIFTLIYFNKRNPIKIKCLYPSVCIVNKEIGSVGSGVIVRSENFGDCYYNVMITCEHIFQEDKRLFPIDYIVRIPVFRNSRILFYEEYPCLIFDSNEDYDLAIVLFFSNQKLECAEIDFDSNLEINDEILKIGYGLGDDLRLDYGNITSISCSLGKYKNLYRTNAFSIFGDSGGPVYYKYKLIGIMHGIRVVGQNPVFEMSFASSIKNLKYWNSELNNIDFVYDKSKKLPEFPILFLDYQSWRLEKK